jgi:hypothetical protein
MSDTVYGYDRYSISTPVQVRRGSAVVLRRQCQVFDHDTYRDTNLNISAATAIRWEVLADFETETAEILYKSLGAGIALVSSGTTGILDITLTSGDTKTLRPGTYKAALAVTLSSGFYKFKPYHFVIAAAPALNEA